MTTSSISADSFQRMPPVTNNGNLEGNWVFVQGISTDNKIVNIASNSIHKPDPIQSNRYGFLINRLQSIEITIDDFSFSIADLMTNPEIKQKLIKKIQKKLEQTKHDFFKQAHIISSNIKSKPLPHHFKVIADTYDLYKKFESIIYLEPEKDAKVIDFIKFAKRVTKFPKKLKKHFHNLQTLDFSTPCKAYESINYILRLLYDVGKLGTSVIIKLDKNPFMKIAFQIIGLGEDFKLVNPLVIDVCKVSALPLNVFQLYFNAVDLYKNIEKWKEISSNPNASPESLRDIKLKLVVCSIDLAKEIALTTLCALTTFGIIPQVPIVVTIIISSIGIIKISINIFNYFAKEHKDKKDKTEVEINSDEICVKFPWHPVKNENRTEDEDVLIAKQVL